MKIQRAWLLAVLPLIALLIPATLRGQTPGPEASAPPAPKEAQLPPGAAPGGPLGSALGVGSGLFGPPSAPAARPPAGPPTAGPPAGPPTAGPPAGPPTAGPLAGPPPTPPPTPAPGQRPAGPHARAPMRPQTPLAFAPSMTFDNATQGPRLAARPASNAYPGPYGGRGPRAMAPGPTPQPMMGSLPRQMVPPQMMMGPQMMPRQMPPQAAMPMPASAFAMRQAAAMGPYGPGAVAPAGFAGPGGPMPMGGFHGPPGGFGGGPVSGCSHCNGYGCNHCLGEGAENGLGMGLGLANLLTPYAGGGYCAPRWFDFWADAVYLQREDVSRRVEFTSDGPRGNAPPVIVLSTDNLSFDDEFGFRATAAVQFLPGGSLEVSYLGQMNWESRAQVVSNTAPLADLLYSAFSDFGTTPPPAPPNNGGFTDTDAAEFARIEYSSTFDTIGLNYRSRWIAPNCRFQGSWIVGVRYFKLDEEFAHDIVVNYPDPNGGINPITGFLNYDVGTSNSMTGFQLGGDLWVTLYPGIRVGADVKAGLFGNRASQRTVVAAQSLANNVVETFESQQVALVSEANFTGLWRVNQHWTVRAGLQVLYIDGVALAAENVNFQPPFGVNPTRTPFINANGNIFYHGATMGLEYMW